VPDVDKGTVTAATDTAPPAAAESPLAGFSEALLTSGMMGNPVGGESGHPENAKAVETSGDAEAPAVETEKPAATPEPVATEDKPEPAQTVNFDGFSDLQRTTWERLLKAGHATPDEVEAARKDALRQDLFSKKTAALARDREAFAKSMAEREGDLKLLDKIRGDDRLHAAWLKASRGELPTDDSDGGDLVDAKKAAEIADARLAQREREREERGVKEQAAYDARKGAMQTALSTSRPRRPRSPRTWTPSSRSIRQSCSTASNCATKQPRQRPRPRRCASSCPRERPKRSRPRSSPCLRPAG
jgi:hypothetical protein